MERQTNPPPAAEIIAIIDREWPDLRRPLVRIALKKLQNPAVAEDLVSQTYEGIRSGSRAWDRQKDPDFTSFAASVLLSNIDHWRKLAHHRRRDYDYDVYEHAAEGHTPDAVEPDAKDSLHKPKLTASTLALSPEAITIIREEIEQAFAVSFDPKGIEYTLLALFKRGVSDPVEQAKVLGISVADLRKLIQCVERIINNAIAKQRKTS